MEILSSTLKAVYAGEMDSGKLRQDTYASVSSIPRLSEPVTYNHFFTEYLLPNRACILGPWATEGWRSRTEWVQENHTLNIGFLKDTFGDAVAPVADCSQVEYDSHPKVDMKVCDYLTKVQKKSSNTENVSLQYLKDWHLQRQFPQYEAYKTPVYFCSDWMNEFWDLREDIEDDYRFVYIGPKGSWTPFHSDVLRSFSWSANICGRKKWIFFPPGEEAKLQDSFGNLPYDLNSLDLEERRKPTNANLHYFEIFQETGEVIFVPSGWYHQVHNLEDTISINHNWFNGCNADLTWLHLVDSERSVQKEISDCRNSMTDQEWITQCQLMLKACAGIDYEEFYRILLTIADRRISSLQVQYNIPQGSASDQQDIDNKAQNSKEPSKDQTVDCTQEQKESNKICDIRHWMAALDHRGKNHCIFDLIQVDKIVQLMLKNSEFQKLDLQKLPQSPQTLLENICKTVKFHMNSEYFDN